MTASAALPATGGTMTGAILNAVGAVGTPSISFTGDTDTGIYHVTANAFSLVTNGATVIALTPAAAAVTGTLSVSGATTLAALTTTGLVSTAASVVGGAGLNIPHGTAPTSPNNGDVWTTSAGGLFARINGATVGPFSAGGVSTTGSPASGNLAKFSGAASVTNGDLSGDVTTSGTLATTVTKIGGVAVGTAATANTGTSGAALGLLNGNNTTSGNNTHSGTETFTGEAIVQAGIDLQTPLTTPTTTEAGYMGVPQNSQATSYGLVAADRGKEVFVTSTSTLTIPANASVAFPIGATIEISADVGATVTIAITTDTLRWVPSNATGSRTLVGPGTAVIQKKKSTEWWIKGDVS